MHVLALDTTTRDGSVALVDEIGIVEERRGDPSRTHAERLPGELLAVAAAHGLSVGDIDLFAVASGPGSFTGLRIGIATIQGLAFTTKRPVVAVSALEALAASAAAGGAAGSLVAAWIDAHRREVFGALYLATEGSRGGLPRLKEVEGPTVGDPAGTLARWAALVGGAPVRVAGDGAVLYSNLLARSDGMGELFGHPLLAGIIGRMALERAAAGEATDPAALRPLYVRRPDAELYREKAALHGRKGS